MQTIGIQIAFNSKAYDEIVYFSLYLIKFWFISWCYIRYDFGLFAVFSALFRVLLLKQVPVQFVGSSTLTKK